MKHYWCPACKRYTVIYDIEYKIWACRERSCLHRLRAESLIPKSEPEEREGE